MLIAAGLHRSIEKILRYVEKRRRASNSFLYGSVRLSAAFDRKCLAAILLKTFPAINHIRRSCYFFFVRLICTCCSLGYEIRRDIFIFKDEDPMQGTEERVLFVYIFPILFVISVFGNLMNIILYQHPYLNSSSTIRLLLFRAVANLLFTLTFIPAYLYAMKSSKRPPNIPYTVHIDDTVEIIYWKTLNVLNFAINVFNTISVWLTLCVTFQLTGLVVWPMYAKNSLPLTVSTWVIAVVISLATLFHGILLLQRDVVSHYCPDDVEIVSHRYLSKSPPKLEEFYYQMQAVLVNILPLFLLIICCVTIGVSSCKKRGTSLVKVRKSSRTQCLLNLAGATTICHFTFEVPSTAVQIAVTFGALFESTFNFTSLIAITNFLIMCNAAFPFLIYIGCSKRYRNLALLICGIRKKRCRYGVEDSTAQRGDDRVQGKKQLLATADDEERELSSSSRLKRSE